MTNEELKEYEECGLVMTQQRQRIAELETALEAKHQQYTGAVIQLEEARKDGERLSAIYELADVFRPGSIVIQLPLSSDAQWDGVTCLWTREIFNAAIDNATAARGAK